MAETNTTPFLTTQVATRAQSDYFYVRELFVQTTAVFNEHALFLSMVPEITFLSFDIV